MSSVKENTKVRTAVIGAGKMGQFHLSKLATHRDSELIGVFDPNVENAVNAAKKFSTRAFENLAELLFEADAVVISTPTEFHHAVAKEALLAGVHVLVEKPIASTSAQAAELVALAASQNLLLMVGHLERYRLRHFLRALNVHEKPQFLYVSPDSTGCFQADVSQTKSM